MTNFEFDFDITNYTIKNIEDFFKFTTSYTEDDINNNIKLMKDKLLNCKELYHLTNEITHFLNKSREYFGPIKLSKLSIRILNQYGEVLELNGYNYFTILEIKQLYNNYK